MSAGRGERHPLARGIVIHADAYNANPESMRVALEELAVAPAQGRRIAVLGAMAELGRESAALHQQLGAFAASLDAIDELIVVGAGRDIDALVRGWSSARKQPPQLLGSVEDVIAAWSSDAELEWLRTGDVVLVKASRAAGLGRCVQHIVEHLGQPEVSA
jgi:UDP-N-acetylmuramoyl-tripeptide--D-alanyl-D-alanine ligase